MSKCSVNVVFAPNGSGSRLYRDLKDALKNDDEAYLMWASTRTPEYINVIGGDWLNGQIGEEKLDINGEPKIEYVLNDSYKMDNALRLKSQKYAERYSKVIQSLENTKGRIDNVIASKIGQLERYKGESLNVTMLTERLKELKAKSNKINTKLSVTNFINAAEESIAYTLGSMEKIMDSPEPNYRSLRRHRTYLDTFNILNDIRSEILSSEIFKKEMKDELAMLDNVIRRKDEVRAKYNSQTRTWLSEELAQYSGKYDATEIEQFLTRAPYDIKSWERLLKYAGDVKDPVVAAVAKVIDTQQQRTRKEEIEFDKNLYDLVKRVEESSPFAGNPEKMYDFMLKKDKDGNYTGQYIHKTYDAAAYRQLKEQYAGTPQLEFYEFFHDNYVSLNKNLPSRYDMRSRIPSVMASKMDIMKKGKDMRANIKNHLGDMVKKSNSDLTRGEYLDDNNEPINSIPVHFTQSYDSKFYKKEVEALMKEDVPEDKARLQALETAKKKMPALLSYDLGRSLQVFHSMSTNYKNMDSVLDVIEGTKEAIGDRDMVATDAKGNPILNKMKDMYGEKLKPKSASNNAHLIIDALVASQVYGQTETDMGTIAGLDTNKLIKGFEKYTSHLYLGVNFNAAMANIGIGGINQFSEAVGGRWFGVKDLIKANKIYFGEIMGIIKDVTDRRVTSKVNLVNEYYNIIGDYRGQSVATDESNLGKRMVKNGSVFFMNSAGEHLMQSKVGIARMNKIKVFDKNGKQLSTLWEAHKVKNGRLVPPKDVYIKKDGKLVKFDQKQEEQFTRDTQYALRVMHGNYNEQTATAAQRHALMGMAMRFRKFIVPGLMRRWEKKKYNDFIGDDVEGYYLTGGRFIYDFVKDLAKFKFDVVKDWKKMTDLEKSNVSKFIFEIGIVAATLGASSVLIPMMREGIDDDDKDSKEYRRKDGALNVIEYHTNRLLSELTFFVSPISAWQLLRNPAASMSALEQTTKVFIQFLPWNIREQYEAGIHKGENKFLVQAGKSIPYYKQLERLTYEGTKAQLDFFKLK